MARPIEDLRFVVVGAYVADCFVDVARMPVWEEELLARSIWMSPGGKALNQAVALARLGAQVTAVGVVGDDGVGRDVLAALSHEGIDVRWVQKRGGVATSVCLCFVSDEGGSSIVWHIDEDVAVTPEVVRAAAPALRGADAVLVTFEAPMPAICEAIGVGHRSGARVVVQPAPVLADPAGAVSVPWDQVDVLVPNEVEARALLAGTQVDCDLPVDGLAEALSAQLGVPAVVVTLGESGCVSHAAGVTSRHPAHTTVAVDTTGASDAFTATLAAYLTAGVAGVEAIDLAQAAAAQAIGRRGGHESMPSAGSYRA